MPYLDARPPWILCALKFLRQHGLFLVLLLSSNYSRTTMKAPTQFQFSVRSLWKLQLGILSLFMILTVCNELLDLPHLLFGDTPTSFTQRKSEVIIELLIYLLVICSELFIFSRLRARIKILEGFLPICANCKKIREDDRWTQMEEYISNHSLASFSHSICPECAKQLYPEMFEEEEASKVHKGP